MLILDADTLTMRSAVEQAEQAEQQDKLWSFMAARPAAGKTIVRIGTQRDGSGRITRAAREATVSIRHAAVTLRPPHNHPGTHPPRTARAVYVREENPPP